MAFLLLTLIALAVGQTCVRDTYASLPAHPSFPSSNYTGALDPVNTFVKNHWSQVVILPRPPNTVVQTQTNCPHKLPGLVDWHNASIWPGGVLPANGTNFTLPTNKSVLISSCSYNKTLVFGWITIPLGSSLIIGDAPITLQAKGIIAKGAFLVGSPTCRLRNKITITIHGARPAVVPASAQAKGIVVNGQIDLHGVEYFPTWTRLAKTALPGNSTIFIQDCPNWQAGQTIVITTTELKDARDFNRNEKAVISSVRKVPSVSSTTCAVTLTTPLLYKHYGGFEYQAEVGLLSRNILVQGDPFNSEATDNSKISCTNSSRSSYACENTFLKGWGVHIMVMNGSTAGRFSGVEVFRGGQTNQLARYPIHWHVCGNVTQNNTYYASDCSVHHSFFRCFTIHGTSGVNMSTGVTLTKNVAYDIIGHCYFCSEDGVEENHTISYNLGAHIHILGPYWHASESIGNDLPYSVINSNGAQSFGSQYTNWVTSNPNLILADDIAASPFYFTNSFNEIYGNAASGGWAGFAFPNLKQPVGFFANHTWFVPKNRPLRLFKGNSAHSTGYWQSHASGVYLGGNLKLISQPTSSSSGTQYTVGRDLPARDTCTISTYGSSVNSGGCPADKQQWLRFEDTKVFLANAGLQSWGNREEIVRFEVHDVGLSTNVFGQVWIDQMLVNCRSKNIPTYLSGCNITGTNYWSCNARDLNWWRSFNGFQFYDTGQSHLVSNTIFQNCQPKTPTCADYPNTGCTQTPPAVTTKIWTYLTHSDQFTPGLMQQTRNITYINVDPNSIMASSTTEKYVSVSGKAANWLDFDGTVVPTLPQYKGSRVNIGSNWTNDWWKFSTNCTETFSNWICPLKPGDSVASIMMHYNITGESTIGSSTCSNGRRLPDTGVWPYGYYPCPQGAMITHFGRTEGTSSYNVSLMPRVSGPLIAASGGWFVRYFGGTPKTISFTDMQIKHNDVMLLAIPYPNGTTFKITAKAPSWCNPGTVPYKSWDAICHHPFRSVGSVPAVRSAWGDTYHYDSLKSLLYIRIVSLASFGYRFATNATYNSTLIWNATSTSDIYFTRPGAPLSILVTGSNAWSVVVEASNCGGTATQCSMPAGVTVPLALSPLPAPVTSPINGQRLDDQPTPEPESSNVGPIVGGAVGGAVGLVLIGLVVAYVVINKGKNSERI